MVERNGLNHLKVANRVLREDCRVTKMLVGLYYSLQHYR